MELKTDSDLYAIIKMQPVFGKYSHLAWAYVELFGIAPMSKHTAKIRSILEVLKMVFQAEAFMFNRKRYGISHAGIGEALNVVVLKNFQDRLENHNYLKKVMIGISEKEDRESGKQAERDLRKKENGLMSGSRYPAAEETVKLPNRNVYPLPAEQVEPPVTQITEEQRRANLARVGNILKGLDK